MRRDLHKVREEVDFSQFSEINQLFTIRHKSPGMNSDKIGLANQVTLCVPSSVISESNARNLEQITSIAYQIARAATTFGVAEIVVLNIPDVEYIAAKKERHATKSMVTSSGGANIKISFSDADGDVDAEYNKTGEQSRIDDKLKLRNDNNGLLLSTLLQYFVTPPYLVKDLFKDSDYRQKFKYAKKLPKLSTLPFMNDDTKSGEFKEGLSVPKHSPRVLKRKGRTSALKKLQVTKFVNVGQSSPITLKGAEIPVHVRVTIDIKNLKIVSPQMAYGQAGLKASFGYFVRYAKSLSSVFTELPLSDGYSESLLIRANEFFAVEEIQLHSVCGPRTGQVLLVAAGLRDLKKAFEDEAIAGVEQVTDMFDGQIEVPKRLRIEDAVMIGLTKAT